ncbi:hypothetical protein V6N13_008774 [Hibiscus sabdariffa]
MKVKEARKILRLHKVRMLFIQENKKEEFCDSEIGRLWYDDHFDFKFSAAVGRSRDLVTIWDKSKFKSEKSLITSRYIVISGYLQVIKKVMDDSSGKNLPLKLRNVKEAIKFWNATREDYNSRVNKLELRINELEKAGDLVALDQDHLVELKHLKLELWDTLKA